jgi:hypothetical protein
LAGAGRDAGTAGDEVMASLADDSHPKNCGQNRSA